MRVVCGRGSDLPHKVLLIKCQLKVPEDMILRVRVGILLGTNNLSRFFIDGIQIRLCEGHLGIQYGWNLEFRHKAFALLHHLPWRSVTVDEGHRSS